MRKDLDGPSSMESWNQSLLRPNSREAAGVLPVELARVWTGGEETASELAEDFIDLVAGGPKEPPDVAEALFENFCGRLSSPADLDDFTGCGSADAPAPLFGGTPQSGRATSPTSNRHVGTTPLPSIGEEWFGFRLRQELGQGSFARVFLAEQAKLAGRPVVVKISSRTGSEPQLLAQLQHTHIVPIYSLHEDAQLGLRVVCMPYFGGATLNHVLHALWTKTTAVAGTDKGSSGQTSASCLGPCHPVSGEQLVHALAAVGTKYDARKAQEDRPSSSPACDAFRTGSYERAIVWIMARLAEGLQHAHDRGILHRDIKPSNILLGADGQPMLLDFNLSQSLAPTQGEDMTTLGGTLVYMAPEHICAFAGANPARGHTVDQRSDLYSLGLVLYEALTGHSPFENKGSYSPLPFLVEVMASERGRCAPSLRAHRPDLPWGLESIVRKCLDPDPAQRYQCATDLADDLRRFLTDQPLKFAPELSRKEQIGKWLRRHPRLTSFGSVLTLAVIGMFTMGACLLGVYNHLQAAQDRERQQNFAKGMTRALCLVTTTRDYQDHLSQGKIVCEETLALYEVLQRADWQQRPAWLRLAPEERHRRAEDTRELLLLLAWARMRTGREDRTALSEALGLLDRAEAVAGLKPSPALWLQRMTCLRRFGDDTGAREAQKQAAQLSPASARDHYLLATMYLLNRDPNDPASYAQATKTALDELNEAIRLNPLHYHSWLQRGIWWHQERDESTLAAADFSVCIGLWPEFALGYFNRGRALFGSGALREAIADYTAAIERDPDFLDAYWNRGLANQMLERYQPALADFERAAQLGRDDAYLHVQRGLVLERLGSTQQADTAFEAAFQRTERATPEIQTGICWWYGFAVHARLPEKARQAFEDVLRQKADHPDALYGCAMLAAEQGQLPQAISFFDRAIAARPSFVEALRFRAVLLARAGQWERARQDINRCLEKEPKGGITLYAAACVCARASERAIPEATEQALAFLERAFRCGYGQKKATTDPDLMAVRQHPKFKQLLARTIRE